ncbi:phosphatase PAP2 family protein [Sphingosinicella sp. YJ22]|uniref:phosphatase PAP2 family protein n=1 Tax=Sphingosinicella sp. YJ22 TaxID=1104780 RepID=UPI00140CB4E6|nr:phosphatase PAP2 family protein [Sphingosinicella sp. YJ22]
MSALSAFSGIDQAVFVAANQIVARSWALDSLMAMALESPVVKAGPLGALFLFAWYRLRGRPVEVRRRVLAITLLAVFLIAPVTKIFSEGAMEPRPVVLAHPGYVLRGGELVESPRLEVRLLQTGELAARAQALRQGRPTSNDFDAFPSDHAAIYVAMALGIFLACRLAGVLALLWTAFVVLGLRVAVGMHWLSDIVVGAAAGAALLVTLQFVGARFAKRLDPALLRWSQRWQGATAAILFLLLIEAAGPMKTMERLRDLVSGVLGGGA